METKANYVLIGAFTLIVGLALLGFGLWAAKYSSDRTWQNYKVVFREAVTGLSVGSPVQYNGIAVGSVTRLSLAPDDPRMVIAEVRVESTTPIKTDTRAKLGITSLTGPTVIQLSGGTPGARELREVDRREQPVIQTSPSALQNISDTANRIADRLDQILSDGNIAHINATLANLEQTSAGLAARRQDIEQLIVNARDASAAMKTTLDTANGTLQGLDRNLVQRLPAVLDKLDASIAKLDAAAGNANAMIAENRPAVRSFTHDGLPQLEPTLVELRGLVRDLRALSGRLQGNPARYLLGRDAPKEYEPK